MNPRPTNPTPAPREDADVSTSVWTTGQRPAALQRKGRYVPESTAHPAKMLPAIAAQAIDTFTRPGEIVLDPMCGIGTTLVEAAHLGRRGLGIEYEPRWVEVAEANLALAAELGAPGDGAVHTGDARVALPALAEKYAGQVRLLITSPPYGSSVHGQVTATPATSRGVVKRDHMYGHDRANLAHRRLPVLLHGFTEILHSSIPLLAPGAIVAITSRPFRLDGELIDFPALALDAAIAAGLVPVQRCAALLAGLRDGQLIPRASFFQLDRVRKLRANGIPASVIGHEDLLLLTAPGGDRAASRRAPTTAPPPASGTWTPPVADHPTVPRPGADTEPRRAAA